MPKFKRKYRKRNYRRKRTLGLTPWYGRWLMKHNSPGDVARAALAGVNYLKGLVNAEMKHIDTTDTGTNVTTTGYVAPLTAVAQGDGISARDGNMISARSINIHGSWLYNPTGSLQSQVVTFWLIMDTQQVSDTAPTFTSIFNNVNVASHLELTTLGRYTILYKRKMFLSSNRPGGNIEVKLPMRHHIRFNGTASTDYQKGAIYLVAVTNEPTNGPQITYQSCLSYRDN